MEFISNIKDIMQITSKAELDDWASESKVVTDIAADPYTGKPRAAIIGDLNIPFGGRKLLYQVVVYNLDEQGNPINGRVKIEDGNILPKEVVLEANNHTFVNTNTYQVIPADQVTDDMKNNVDYGNGYMREYDFYRFLAKSGNINIFALLEQGVKTSTKI